MLDYIFTRLYRFYEEREREGNSIFSSSIYISVLRMSLFYSAVMMLDIFSGGRLSILNLHFNHTGGSVVFILAFIALINYDYMRFKRIHRQILNKHKKKPCNRWFKIWMVAALIIIILLSPVLWRELYKLF